MLNGGAAPPVCREVRGHPHSPRGRCGGVRPNPRAMSQGWGVLVFGCLQAWKVRLSLCGAARVGAPRAVTRDAQVHMTTDRPEAARYRLRFLLQEFDLAS